MTSMLCLSLHLHHIFSSSISISIIQHWSVAHCALCTYIDNGCLNGTASNCQHSVICVTPFLNVKRNAASRGEFRHTFTVFVCSPILPMANETQCLNTHFIFILCALDPLRSHFGNFNDGWCVNCEMEFQIRKGNAKWMLRSKLKNWNRVRISVCLLHEHFEHFKNKLWIRKNCIPKRKVHWIYMLSFANANRSRTENLSFFVCAHIHSKSHRNRSNSIETFAAFYVCWVSWAANGLNIEIETRSNLIQMEFMPSWMPRYEPHAAT